MLSPEFDFDAAEDQFPSHVEIWKESGFGDLFDQIDPRSIVGQIIVNLIQTELACQEAKEELEERYMSEVDQAMHEEEISAAKQAFDVAYSRTSIFEGIYTYIYEQRGAVDYQTVVSGAQEDSAREIDLMDLAPDFKDELLELNNNICFFFDLESDQHFQQLPVNR